jgi:hypothetical protein
VDLWSVQADEEPVTVPAGTFSTRVFIRRGTAGASDKVYSFVKGIGKVRETGSQQELLVDCTIGGKTCDELTPKQ